jgi:hypothetical protein
MIHILLHLSQNVTGFFTLLTPEKFDICPGRKFFSLFFSMTYNARGVEHAQGGTVRALTYRCNKTPGQTGFLS